jgi:hypothetical protein
VKISPTKKEGSAACCADSTILCVFKNKNIKELDIIAEECSGEVDVDNIMISSYTDVTVYPYWVLRSCFSHYILGSRFGDCS